MWSISKCSKTCFHSFSSRRLLAEAVSSTICWKLGEGQINRCLPKRHEKQIASSSIQTEVTYFISYVDNRYAQKDSGHILRWKKNNETLKIRQNLGFLDALLKILRRDMTQYYHISFMFPRLFQKVSGLKFLFTKTEMKYQWNCCTLTFDRAVMFQLCKQNTPV